MNLSCIIEEDQVHLSTDDLHVTVQITQSL